MGIGELQTIATVSAFVAFVGVAWWAYSPKNKKRFEEDAQLALDDEDVKKMRYSDSQHWYGDNFLVYGKQVVKNSKTGERRKVFAVTKYTIK